MPNARLARIAAPMLLAAVVAAPAAAQERTRAEVEAFIRDQCIENPETRAYSIYPDVPAAAAARMRRTASAFGSGQDPAGYFYKQAVVDYGEFVDHIDTVVPLSSVTISTSPYDDSSVFLKCIDERRCIYDFKEVRGETTGPTIIEQDFDFTTMSCEQPERVVAVLRDYVERSTR